MGNNDVLIEQKLEADTPEAKQGRVFTTIKEAVVVGYRSIEKELEKLRLHEEGRNARYARIDETH